MNEKEKIVEKSKQLNRRSLYAAKTNQILATVYGKNFADIKKWADGKRHRTDFINNYNLYLLRILAIELCVILDSADTSKDQYSIDVLLSTVDQYLYNSRSPDGQLFDRPEEIMSAMEFEEFCELNKSGVKTEPPDDKKILSLLNKEKKTFVKIHSQSIDTLKKCRNEFLAHPDIDGSTLLPSADELIKISEWCFAYCNLFLNTLTASGVRLYTKEGRNSCLQKIDKNYSKFFKELMS